LNQPLNKLTPLHKREVYNELFLERTSNEEGTAHYHESFGQVKDNQGDYAKAIWYYKKST
jgi:hypothetical protein